MEKNGNKDFDRFNRLHKAARDSFGYYPGSMSDADVYAAELQRIAYLSKPIVITGGEYAAKSKKDKEKIPIIKLMKEINVSLILNFISMYGGWTFALGASPELWRVAVWSFVYTFLSQVARGLLRSSK